MASLRLKVIVSLIGMVLLAIAIGAISSRVIMLDRFERMVVERASAQFVREVLRYYEHFGSWEAGAEAGGFFAFTNPTIGEAQRRTQGPPPRGERSSTGPVPVRPAPREFEGMRGAPPPIIVTDMDRVVHIPGPAHNLGDVLEKAELKRAYPLMNGDEQIGYLLPGARDALTAVELSTFDALRDSWLISILIILCITIPAGILLGRGLTRPIRNLSQAVVAMQPGAVHQQVPVTSDDELGQLSNSFNIMSSEMASFVQIIEEQKEKILETEALRKQGMASISHELRTPLNNCVAQANAMLDGVRPMDQAQMSLLSGSLDHLTKLVDDLFQLALADVNALECAEEIVDFSVLVNDALDTKTADVAKTDSELVRKLPDKLEVLGDAKRLRQIVDNLLENCFRYAEQGATITVSLKREAEFAELCISDNGPGVPVEDLESIFDRFYRAESSRDRNTGGTGLGLSLVKAWAQAQGGSARAFLVPDGGLGIKVYIPLARSHLRQNTAAYG